VAEVALRPVDDSDLDALFEQMRDPESVRMAAFTAENPDDRTAFDVHMAKVRTSPGVGHSPGPGVQAEPADAQRR
jgi:hypothetical protein